MQDLSLFTVNELQLQDTLGIDKYLDELVQSLFNVNIECLRKAILASLQAWLDSRAKDSA